MCLLYQKSHQNISNIRSFGNTVTSPRILLSAWNLRPSKRRGQNFLSDPSTAEMIVARAKIKPEDIVLEIGAGLGALTIPLARNVKKVYAVENDQQIIDLLRIELLGSDVSNVVITKKNVLYFDINEITEAVNHKIVVMGNLPYNISSQVIVKLIKSRNLVGRAVLMLQKELAQRIAAKPGCKDYGRLTVMLRYCANINVIADVKSHLFFPKPKVDSRVIEIEFKDSLEYLADDETFFSMVVKSAFGKRRKTLKNALAGSELDIDAKRILHVLESVGIDPIRRAETLTVQEFVRLSNGLKTPMFS